jgi:hypothetical protein
MELVELFADAVYSGDQRMLDSLYKIGYQQASSDLSNF